MRGPSASCTGKGAGLTTCGSGAESCCTTIAVNQTTKLDKFQVTGNEVNDYRGDKELPAPVQDLSVAYRSVSERRLFAKLPDGMTVDAQGGVWVAVVMGVGEIVRFKPDGMLDRRVKVPAKSITSVALGGPDMRDLYAVRSITAMIAP